MCAHYCFCLPDLPKIYTIRSRINIHASLGIHLRLLLSLVPGQRFFRIILSKMQPKYISAPCHIVLTVVLSSHMFSDLSDKNFRKFYFIDSLKAVVFRSCQTQVPPWTKKNIWKKFYSNTTKNTLHIILPTHVLTLIDSWAGGPSLVWVRLLLRSTWRQASTIALHGFSYAIACQPVSRHKHAPLLKYLSALHPLFLLGRKEQ